MTRGYKTLCNAIAAGDLTALETAIERHPDAVSHWKPVVDAAHAGRADMVRALITAGADPNVISGTGARHTPLTRLTEHHATIPRHDGHREALVALLEGGANPNLRAGPHHVEPLAYASGPTTSRASSTPAPTPARRMQADGRRSTTPC